MPSDIKALLKLFLGAFLVAIGVMGVLFLAATGVLSKEIAAIIALVAMIVGIFFLSRLIRPKISIKTNSNQREIEYDDLDH